MPRHIEKRRVPYTPAQMFDLVAAIDRYPDFLPWCQKAVIHQRTEGGVVAELYVGAKGFNERFTSIVSFEPHSLVKVRYGGGALAHLSNEWRFDPLPDGGCEITFFVDFAVKSVLKTILMDAFFEYAFKKMVRSFEARANELYA